MERPERMVLLILGTLTDRMAPVLWVMAFFSNLTVVHRIAYTWKETSKLKPLASSQLGYPPRHSHPVFSLQTPRV